MTNPALSFYGQHAFKGLVSTILGNQPTIRWASFCAWCKQCEKPMCITAATTRAFKSVQILAVYENNRDGKGLTPGVLQSGFTGKRFCNSSSQEMILYCLHAWSHNLHLVSQEITSWTMLPALLGLNLWTRRGMDHESTPWSAQKHSLNEKRNI